MSRQATIWVVAALFGIALAAAITWATSQLTSQRIGIASEPISAAGQLAPRRVEVPVRHSVRKRHVAKPVHTSSTSTSEAASVPTNPAQPEATTAQPTVTLARPVQTAPRPAVKQADDGTDKGGGGERSSGSGSGGSGSSQAGSRQAKARGGEGSGHGRDD